MIDAVYGWIKNISFYLILITAVLNVLPNNSYKKYVRLFTGMVLILLLISPLASLLNFEDMLNFNIETASYKQEIASVQENTKYFENVQSDYLTKAYKTEAETRIEQIVEQNGMYPVTVGVEIDTNIESETFGDVTGVTITASYNEQSTKGISVDKVTIGGDKQAIDSYEQVNIKNEVESFYNISADNINISIQR